MTTEDGTPTTPRPFDVEMIGRLIELMADHDMNEIHLREGEHSIRLRRGAESVPMPIHLPAASPSVSVPSSSVTPPPEPPKASAKNLIDIKSPMVGTFYTKPKPDAKVFVDVGSRVKAETVVCIVEAMKVLNTIEAECAGVIVEVVAKDAQPVEFGTVLFRVDPQA